MTITLVSTYTPVILRPLVHSDALVGVVVGGEGIFALTLSVAAGIGSDQLDTRLGGRLPFLLAGAPLLLLALAIVGLTSSVVGVVCGVALFFAGYFLIYEPYRALYPDLLDTDISSRAQGIQALWRGAGTGLALVGGGLLLALARPLPFLLAGVIAFCALVAFAVCLPMVVGVFRQKHTRLHSARQVGRELVGLLKQHPALRVFLIANVLWELSLAALKTFVVLFITVGLGYSLNTAAVVIGAVAAVVLVASPTSGRLGDRYGPGRVMVVALCVYAVGLLVPFLSHAPEIVLSVLPLIAFGGGVIMTLPYALLMPMMPSAEHGVVTGLYSLSRGLGTLCGPLVAGIAIQALSGPLAKTHGYSAMWLVSSASVVATIPLLVHLIRSLQRDRRALERA